VNGGSGENRTHTSTSSVWSATTTLPTHYQRYDMHLVTIWLKNDEEKIIAADAAKVINVIKEFKGHPRHSFGRDDLHRPQHRVTVALADTEEAERFADAV
jgi:hypothetical protein